MDTETERSGNIPSREDVIAGLSREAEVASRRRVGRRAAISFARVIRPLSRSDATRDYCARFPTFLRVGRRKEELLGVRISFEGFFL